MKNILIIALLVLAGTLLGADDLQPKTHATTHNLTHYTQDLENSRNFRFDVKALCSVFEHEERIPAWIALDVIRKYQLPGHDVVTKLPTRGSLTWNISDEGLASVVRHIVTEETLPLILAKRQASAWCSLVGWAADHMPSIAATAKQSQLDALRAGIMKEYQHPCVAAPRSDTYKKTDDLLALLPEESR